MKKRLILYTDKNGRVHLVEVLEDRMQERNYETHEREAEQDEEEEKESD